jgi:ABC-type proline/glycine betaine transport system permease subunit
VNHFDAVEDDAGGCGRLEAEHRPNTALDPPMVLLDSVVQILALADSDRLQSAPAAILQLICCVAGNDRLMVGLAAVDDDTIGTLMALERFPEETLGRRQIPMFAEIEFDRVADAVDGAVEIHPFSAHPDVGLVDMPPAGDGALAPVDALQEQGREADDPAVDCRMIDADGALGHHLLQIAQAQPIGKVPANAKQDDGSIEMAALEHLNPPKIIDGHCQTSGNQRVCNRTRVFGPFINFLYAIVEAAWIPLFVVWWGYGFKVILVLLIYIIIFPVLYNTMLGVRTVPQIYLNAARSLGASRLALLTHVILPAALPNMITGFRVGAGFAFRGLIFAEMLAANTGIGYLIYEGVSTQNTARTIVGMICMGLTWLVMDTMYLRPLESATVERWELVVTAEKKR